MDIPNDNIIKIALNESIEDIIKMCRVNSHFNNLLCNNNYFWKLKFINDFGLPDINIISWKEAYFNYGKFIVFGSFGMHGDYVYLNDNISTQTTGIRAKFISCGYSHIAIIDSNNDVWTFGENDDGQLGLGDNEDRTYPVLLPRIKAKFISCGHSYTMIIDLNDNVWGFGTNYNGELGLEDNIDRNIPTLLPLSQERKIKFISCGSHTMMIDSDHNVWACGPNTLGELGLGDDVNRYVPTQILGFKAKFVSSGHISTMIIDLDDNVWGFGYNRLGVLGLGDNIHRNIPTLLPWSYENKAKFVYCSNSYAMIIDTNDNVWAFGYNGYGQLGLGDTESRNIPTQIPEIKARSVSCGNNHTIIIDINNNVWGFGDDRGGQLNSKRIDWPYDNTLYPIQLGIKALSVSCGAYNTMIILDPNPEFESNVYLIPFNEAIRKLNSGDVSEFWSISLKYQSIPHNPDNYIIAFYGHEGNIYLAEAQYDQSTSQIYPPV
jgi:alpha-tubulin suppressor-like RCC1 family protein